MNALRGQRATAHALAKKLESGEALTSLQGSWAGAIIAGMATHFPKPASRPPKDWNERAQHYAMACQRAGAALLIQVPIQPEDVPSAALALRTWARGLRSNEGRGRPGKIPGDAAVLVEMAHLSGKSKRDVIDEIAERSGADVSNVERAVKRGRMDAKTLLRWAESSGATVHPKRKK